MKKFFLLLFALFLAAGARAQSTSHSWIDVTTFAPAGTKTDCSGSPTWGTYINSAINSAPAGSAVIFFPAGCYLINTQIVDTKSASNLTYLGFGNVELRANGASSSVIKFGDDTTTVGYRSIENIYFNCYNGSIDGIDIDGLKSSAFDDIVIANCYGTAAMRTVGTNGNNFDNVVKGGTIFGTNTSNGVQLGLNGGGPNAWSFFGTTIVAGGSSGTGLDFEGSGGGMYGGTVQGWDTGIAVIVNNTNGSTPPLMGSIVIDGNYLEDNATYGIRVGKAGTQGDKGVGVTITGNYINCRNDSNGKSSVGVELDQTSGFSITSNRIRQCAVQAVKGLSDGTYQGADNGFIGANYIDGGQGILLQGSNNTVTSSLATKSANYTLSGADSWINVTGNTTITIPHAMTAQQWNVFNSGTGNVTLVCDSGTINNQNDISFGSEIGKTVTTDGTNCFAH